MILKAKQKPILTMLEWIRQCLMKRMQENRDLVDKKWKRYLYPSPRSKLKKNMERVKNCITREVRASNWEVFEMHGSQYNVNLDEMTCTCRRWDLTGIPCSHAIAVFDKRKLDVESFVHKCYCVEVYKVVYSSTIYGINRKELGGDTYFIPPLPPKFLKKRGRPSNARRKCGDESSRKGKKRK